MNPDADLARARFGVRHGLVSEHVRRTILMDDDRLHASPCGSDEIMCRTRGEGTCAVCRRTRLRKRRLQLQAGGSRWPLADVLMLASAATNTNCATDRSASWWERAAPATLPSSQGHDYAARGVEA